VLLLAATGSAARRSFTWSAIVHGEGHEECGDKCGCHEIPTSEEGGEIFLKLSDGAELTWWTEDLPLSWTRDGAAHLCEALLDEETVHGFMFVHMLGIAMVSSLADKDPCVFWADSALVEVSCWSAGDFMDLIVERRCVDDAMALNRTTAILHIPFNGAAGPCDCTDVHRALIQNMKRLYSVNDGPWNEAVLMEAMSAVLYASDPQRYAIGNPEQWVAQQQAFARRVEGGEDIHDTLESIGFFSLRVARKAVGRFVVPMDGLTSITATAALQVASPAPPRRGLWRRRGRRRVLRRRRQRSAAAAGATSPT